MRVFVDTSAFIALLVTSEQKHQQCVEKYQQYKQQNDLFYTNNLVLAEVYTRILYDLGRDACRKVIEKIQDLQTQGKLKVFQVDKIIATQSEKLIIKFAEHKLSFTDVSIYSMVKEYKLDEIFTLDADFKKVGLPASF